MRRDFARTLPSLVLLGCTPSTALDDEVGATTAMDESSSTEGTSEGMTFVPEDDSSVPSCDPFAQDCPVGEKCVPYAEDGAGTWTANKCVPIMGDGAPGEPCWSGGIAEGTDDCVDQPGTVCTAFFEDGFAPPEHEDVGICILPP